MVGHAFAKAASGKVSLGPFYLLLNRVSVTLLFSSFLVDVTRNTD